MSIFEIAFKVPESDTANFAKHVHHADLVRFLELARLEYLKSLGFSYEFFVSRGELLVITEITVSYKREIRSETIRMTVENVRVERKMLVMEQVIYNSVGKEAARALVKQAFVSLESRRAVEVPEYFLVCLK